MNRTFAFAALIFCAALLASVRFGAAWAADSSDSAAPAASDHAAGDHTAGDLGSLFDKLDANHDGQITSDEVPQEHRRLFDRLLRRADKNSDGKLSRDEFMAGMSEDRPKKVADGADRPANRPGAIADSTDGKSSNKMASDAPKNALPESPSRAGFGSGGFGGGAMAGIGPGPFMGIAIFRALDTNGDGKLDAKEIAAAGDVLKKLTNGSGEITREELLKSLPPGMGPGPGGGFFGGAAGIAGAPESAGGRGAGRQGRGPGGGVQGLGRALGLGRGGADEELKPETALKGIFTRFDANGDGKLQKDELPPAMEQRFDELDANHDGVLDEAEIKAILPRILQRMEQARAQGGPGAAESPSHSPSTDEKSSNDKTPEAK